MPATLSTRQLTVVRGATTVLDRVDLSLGPGRCFGVVGPNGVGKSTLLAACAGVVAPERGEVVVSPPTATIGWLAQEPERSDETVREMWARRTGVAAASAELDAATADLAAERTGAADRYDLALQRWLALGAADLDSRIGTAAADVGLSADVFDRPTATLSGGQAARAGLVALGLSRFDVYLLDEPTNDLDLAGLGWLEGWVLAHDAPIMLVSHDRRFLERVVTDVVEIDWHTHRVTVFGGGWRSYLDERERAKTQAWRDYEIYDDQRRALASRAQRQREWAQQGRSKVAKSGENDKYIRSFRIDQTEKLAGKAAATERALGRLDAVEKPRVPWELRLDIPDARRSGDVAAVVSGMVLERSGFTLGPVDLELSYGDRLAVMGANGAGKTTLVDVLLGRLAPTAGVARLGAGVVVGEIEQVRAQLGGEVALLRSFVDASGLTVPDARTLLAKFGLFGDHIDRVAASLSPGERTRASLALLMANGANLLVLDEPTNHLDLAAIEQLERALDTFAGTVILITHDREFLERVRVTRTIVLDDGRVVDADRR